MSYRNKNKLLASVLAAVMAPAAALGTVVLTESTAEAATKKARCDVHAVLASKEGNSGIPKDLKFLEAQLKADDFAAYKSFFLVEKQSAKATLDKAAEFTFRSGNRLGLSLLGDDGAKLKLHAKLTSRDGESDLLNMDYSIVPKGVMIVAGGEFEHRGKSGRLFLAWQCDRAG